MIKHSKSQLVTLKDIYQLPFSLFLMYGIRLYRWSPEERLTLIHGIFFANLILHILVYAVLVPMFYIATPPETLAELLDAAITIMFFLTAVVRFLAIIVGRKGLKKFIDLSKEYYPTTVKEQKIFEVEKTYKESNNVAKMIFGCSLFSSISFLFAPLFKYFLDRSQTDDKLEFGYQVPFAVWYPFEVNNAKRYTFVIVTQIFGCLTCVLGLVDYLNQIFDVMLLFSYFAVSCCLCLTSVNMLVGSYAVDIARQSSLLSVSLFDMYQLCKHGEDMINLVGSTDISEALAEHPWYNGSIHYQRMLIFPMARAQRPAALRASKFFVVSMESFQSVNTSCIRNFFYSP
uniref:Odorant receptor n=1 Tax=Glossina brevipalpis TaxID=37001 RepID=A0A1A9W0R5_9MUSC